MAYSPPPNDAVDFTVEDYSQPGNAEVDFTIGEPEEEEPPPPFSVTTDRLDLPFALDLPLGPLNLSSMQTGVGVFIVGMIAVTGGGAYLLRNYIALALTGLAVVALLMSGTLGIGLELFWAVLIATVLTIVVGALFRVIA